MTNATQLTISSSQQPNVSAPTFASTTVLYNGRLYSLTLKEGAKNAYLTKDQWDNFKSQFVVPSLEQNKPASNDLHLYIPLDNQGAPVPTNTQSQSRVIPPCCNNPDPWIQMAHNAAKVAVHNPTTPATPSGKFAAHSPSSVKAPRPIPNMGNTCFMASLLQLIANDPDLKKDFIKASPAIANFFHQHRPKNPLNRQLFTEVYKACGMRMGKQEDSSEAITRFTSMIATSIPSLTAIPYLRKNYCTNPNDPDHSSQEREEVPKIRKNPNEMEPLPEPVILSAPIASDHSKYPQLQALLDQSLHTPPDPSVPIKRDNVPLDAPTLYADVQEVYEEAPQSFILHLNRGMHHAAHLTKKDTRNILGTTHLTLPLRNNVKSRQYKLQSFVVHEGKSTHSGHYMAYVHTPDNKYYRCDDARITPIKESAFLKASQQATLLHYRIDP